MHILTRIIVILCVYFSLFPTLQATAAEQCQATAILGLQRLSPRGYEIYKAMKDKSQFMTWVTCDDLQLDLATAVHESVHNLTEERDAYPLIGGGNIPRPHEVEDFFAPKLIAKTMTSNFDDDLFIKTYLEPGSASSADNFMYLLDEMNAFSHDLNTASLLTSMHTSDSQIDHRDGLAAMMAFVTGYAGAAQKERSTTWEGLNAPEPRKTVQTLWKQAETVLAASCGIPDFGTHDQQYISYVCDPKNNAALTDILQRPPVCPVSCLTGEPPATAQ